MRISARSLMTRLPFVAAPVQSGCGWVIQLDGGKAPVLVTGSGKVTERFTRWRDQQILYAFTIEDPNVYTRPWRWEMSLNSTQESAFEYACHEGRVCVSRRTTHFPVFSQARGLQMNSGNLANPGRGHNVV
jgi:hypothetical protein